VTYANKGTEFPDDCARAGLSDAAYRTHDEAIVWLYRVEETSLRIPKHLVRRFAGSDDFETAIKELVEIGFWRDRGDAWQVVHHSDVIRQRLAAQMAKRARDRRAQRNHRKRNKKPDARAGVSADISADVIPDAVCLPATNNGGAGGGENPSPLRTVKPGGGGAAA
jgi:hypothetical protein